MRATRAYIKATNIKKNIQAVMSLSQGRKICAAVKTNAYGHGAVGISRLFEKEKIDFLSVATVEEAEEIQNAKIKTPIILLGICLPEDFKNIVSMNLHPLVGSVREVQEFNRIAAEENRKLAVHLKIDTGMGRLGCSPEEALKIAEEIHHSSHIIFEGICTHFSSAYDLDTGRAETQLALFKATVEEIRSAGIDPGLVHCSNSAAIMHLDNSLLDMVRPGIVLYGYTPEPKLPGSDLFKPALKWVSQIVFLKKVPKGTPVSYSSTYHTRTETWIATIPVGYADGYRRSLSNVAAVIINGVKYPVVGRVCMDQLMVEVDSTVNLYDEVTLLSPEDPEINADSLAEICDTINYDILTGIGPRVHRIFID